METILIAGGTGLIGRQLQQYWSDLGHEVRLLTRKPSDPSLGIYNWNPLKEEMDEQALEGVTVLVNLSGAGIGDKRWTASRRKELFDSRVGTTRCLWKYAQSSSSLKRYITASGAVCYGFEDDDRVYSEESGFGTDLLSVLTREWEAAADLFAEKYKVTKIRTGVVFAAEGGALQTIAKPVRMGFGAILGSGKQAMPWIHLKDLVRLFDWILTRELSGVFHANAGNTDNATLTQLIAKVFGKKLRMPKVPSMVIRLLFGKMAVMVLKGLKTDNSKIRSTGFIFEYTELEQTLKDVLK